MIIYVFQYDYVLASLLPYEQVRVWTLMISPAAFRVDISLQPCLRWL